MSMYDPQEVATIAPEAAAKAHQNFQHLYADVLSALPTMNLRWRLDVETREPDQSPEQQHQLVIWEAQQRHSHTYKQWLQEDGSLENLVGGQLSAAELFTRIMACKRRWEWYWIAEEWQPGLYAKWAQVIRTKMYLATVLVLLLTGAAAGVFGRSRWVLAGRDTCVLLLVMSVVLTGWLRWHVRQVAKGVPPMPSEGPKAHSY